MHADLSWVGVLEHHARRAPDHVLATHGDEAVTYGEMAARAAALAAGLHARGVGPGDVVGLLSYNCTEFLETIFAANHLGAIAMPVNWRLAAAELRYILDHSEARAPDGWETLADVRAEGVLPRVRVTADAVHRLMYTSGTTGRPKGVMLTHANLAWKNYAHIAEFGFTASDVGLACGPLYHVGALDLVTTSMIAVGATTIIHRTFDAAAVVDEIERSRVTT